MTGKVVFLLMTLQSFTKDLSVIIYILEEHTLFRCLNSHTSTSIASFLVHSFIIFVPFSNSRSSINHSIFTDLHSLTHSLTRSYHSLTHSAQLKGWFDTRSNLYYFLPVQDWLWQLRLKLYTSAYVHPSLHSRFVTFRIFWSMCDGRGCILCFGVSALPEIWDKMAAKQA